MIFYQSLSLRSQIYTISYRTCELTSIAITTADYFSLSNPTLSLPQSSSTFPNLSNQSDMSEIYHNSKRDIAE